MDIGIKSAQAVEFFLDIKQLKRNRLLDVSLWDKFGILLKSYLLFCS